MSNTKLSARTRLAHIRDVVDAFQPPQLPVITNDTFNSEEALPGLRSLRQEIKRDVEKLVHSTTNAPYLVAVWDELVHAHQPIAIYRNFSPGKNGLKNHARGTIPVKVDIVAENGARWIRVNTITNARLAMEFRETDSYLTSDDDEQPFQEVQLDNSVLRMGRALLAAAQANPVTIPPWGKPSISQDHYITTIVPKVTLRLTRLRPDLHSEDEKESDDPRIEQTIRQLCDMGIDIQFGERPSYSLSSDLSPTPPLLMPTTDINLDLSALIALISDISHAPLPRTERDAYDRFIPPPQSYLDMKKDRSRQVDEDEMGSDNSDQHALALAAQLIQEMQEGNGILEEILVRSRTSDRGIRMRVCTTREARRRCLQIVAKIGGEREKERAHALLGYVSPTSSPSPAFVAEAEEKYWCHSRYPAGFVPSLVPVQVYPSTLPNMIGDDHEEMNGLGEKEDRRSAMTFWHALAQTCTNILGVEGSLLSAPCDEGEAQGGHDDDGREEHGDILAAVQTSVPKLTVHTVASMLAGASRRHTTLTANKSSVRAVLRGMMTAEGSSEMVQSAALWIVHPRSLAECMRSDSVLHSQAR